MPRPNPTTVVSLDLSTLLSQVSTEHTTALVSEQLPNILSSDCLCSSSSEAYISPHHIQDEVAECGEARRTVRANATLAIISVNASKSIESVRSWADRVIQSEAPNHTPWEFSAAPCVRPESQLTVHPQKQGSLRSASASEDNTGAISVLFNKASYAQEITVAHRGRTRCMSIPVPASLVNHRTAEGLGGLNNGIGFLKDRLDGLNDAAVLTDREKSKMQEPTPTLILSDSQHDIPVSLESSSNLVPSTEPLASRRGKNVSPLRVASRSVSTQDSYPGIPTAFLGSPSANSPYSPAFPQVMSDGDPETAIDEMIRSLRAQCDTIALSPILQEFKGEKVPRLAAHPSIIEQSGTTSQEVSRRDRPMRRSRSYTVLESSEARRLSSAPPQLPLPPLPLYTLKPSSTQRAVSLEPQRISPPMQGILKMSRNVRFASLPHKRKHQSAPSVPSGADTRTQCRPGTPPALGSTSRRVPVGDVLSHPLPRPSPPLVPQASILASPDPQPGLAVSSGFSSRRTVPTQAVPSLRSGPPSRQPSPIPAVPPLPRDPLFMPPLPSQAAPPVPLDLSRRRPAQVTPAVPPLPLDTLSRGPVQATPAVPPPPLDPPSRRIPTGQGIPRPASFVTGPRRSEPMSPSKIAKFRAIPSRADPPVSIRAISPSTNKQQTIAPLGVSRRQNLPARRHHHSPTITDIRSVTYPASPPKLPSVNQRRRQTFSSIHTAPSPQTVLQMARRGSTVSPGPFNPLANVPIVQMPLRHEQSPSPGPDTRRYRIDHRNMSSVTHSIEGRVAPNMTASPSQNNMSAPPKSSSLHGRKFSVVNENELRREGRSRGGSLRGKVPEPFKNIFKFK